jgi:hypothetical protein
VRAHNKLAISFHGLEFGPNIIHIYPYFRITEKYYDRITDISFLLKNIGNNIEKKTNKNIEFTRVKGFG